MKWLFSIVLYFILILPVNGQTVISGGNRGNYVPQGNRKYLIDSLWVAKNAKFVDLYSYFEAGDTTILKTLVPDSVGATVYLRQLSSASTLGGGWVVYADSAYPETYGGVVYGATTAGKQWVLVDFLNKRTLNPLDFGAIPNDGVDDATAFQSCLDFAGSWVESGDSGIAVIVSPGKYHIGTSLQIPYKVNVLSPAGSDYIASSSLSADGNYAPTSLNALAALSGAIVKFKANGPAWSSYYEQNSMIQGILFNGRNQTTLASTDGLLTIEDMIGVEISNCMFYKSKNDGIEVIHSLAWSVENSPVLQCDSNGVKLRGASTDFRITGSQIGLCGKWGIYIDAGSQAGRVYGNKVFNNGQGGIFALGGVTANILINTNDIHDNNGAGISLNSSVDDISIVGNTIWRTDSIGIYLTGCNNITIVGNQLGGQVNTDQEYGVYIDANVDSLSIIGNTFKETETQAVFYTTGDNYFFFGNQGFYGEGYADLYNDFNAASIDSFDLTVNAYQVVHLLATKSRAMGNVEVQGDSALKVLQKGVYKIHFNVAVQLTDSAATVQFHPFENDAYSVEMQQLGLDLTAGMPNQIVAGEFHGFVNLDANDVIHMQIRNITDNSDAYIKRINFSIEQKRASQQ
jgi:hypothetical protein